MYGQLLHWTGTDRWSPEMENGGKAITAADCPDGSAVAWRSATVTLIMWFSESKEVTNWALLTDGVLCTGSMWTTIKPLLKITSDKGHAVKDLLDASHILNFQLPAAAALCSHCPAVGLWIVKRALEACIPVPSSYRRRLRVHIVH